MKCPKCGREIPDGSLFCKYCFADIRIVPTYESNVEENIQDVMSGIQKDVQKQAQKDEEKAKMKAESRARARKYRNRFVALLVLFVAIAAVYCLVTYQTHHSEEYFLQKAEQQAQTGDYDAAAQTLQSAIQTMEGSSTSLMLQRASYLEQAGHYEEAISLCKLIISSSSSSEEDIQTAYGTIIQVYQDTQDYAKINEMLTQCGDESVQEMYSEYMVYVPEASPESGTYAADLAVTFSVKGDSSIFYTMSSRVPTTSDTLYAGDEIVLGPGTYTITAIAVNHYGISSDPVRVHYTVEDPEASEGSTEVDSTGSE